MKLKVNNVFNSTNENSETSNISLNAINEMFNMHGIGGLDRDIGEITYYTCIKILSETMGKLNVKLFKNGEKGVEEIKDHNVINILRTKPNPYITASLFWATVEYYRNHYGNAYVWQRRINGELKDLWIMHPNAVSVVVDNAGLFGKDGSIRYIYTDEKTGKVYIFLDNEVLHYRTFITENGITGLSIRDILATTIKANKTGQKFLNNVYSQGVTGKAVLEYTGDLNELSKKRLVNGLEEYASGVDNSGKIIPVPLGMKLTPLNLSLVDIQFLEIRKYSALQIASAFGIKPNQINNYEKSSYSNSEMQNLSFYVDTLLFILNSYEQEDTYKLLTETERNKGYYLKRNVKGILRADFKTQMQSLVQGVSTGIYQINEARKELDLPEVEGGDRNIVNGTYIPLNRVGDQYGENDMLAMVNNKLVDIKNIICKGEN